eukprot:TRINITY_DN12244_c0_g1_i1.p1 TRINITY_DN12244_c0_g1~~TRINITY_DN12244_c0_g1_i1.p1  ORF type:complete len:594 (-),score=125.51 TRINITY_DN12244_c0_g1_i1:53-1834(-)
MVLVRLDQQAPISLEIGARDDDPGFYGELADVVWAKYKTAIGRIPHNVQLVQLENVDGTLCYCFSQGEGAPASAHDNDDGAWDECKDVDIHTDANLARIEDVIVTAPEGGTSVQKTTLNTLVCIATNPETQDQQILDAAVSCIPQHFSPQSVMKKLIDRYNIPRLTTGSVSQRQHHRINVVVPVQRAVCNVLSDLLTSGFFTQNKAAQQMFNKFVEEQLPSDGHHGIRLELLKAAESLAMTFDNPLRALKAMQQQRTQSAKATHRVPLRLYLWNRTFVTLAIESSVGAREVVQAAIPKIQVHWTGHPITNLALYAVENDVERVMDPDERPLPLRERWQGSGVEPDSTTYLFAIHDPAHAFIPFSKPLPIEREGYLVKKGGKAEGGRGPGAWQKRWMRLSGTTISYHKKPSEVKPRGLIELQGAHVYDAESRTGKRHSFEVMTVERSFFIHASTAAEREQWLQGMEGKASTINRTQASPDVDCEGYMDKYGGRNRTRGLQQRWFVLRGAMLQYYMHPPRTGIDAEKGHIDLSQSTLRESEEHEFGFVLTSTDRKLEIDARNPEQYTRWLASLRRHVHKLELDIDAAMQAAFSRM